MILKKNKIRYIYKKIDVNLIEQFKHQNEEKFLKNLMYTFFNFSDENRSKNGAKIP